MIAQEEEVVLAMAKRNRVIWLTVLCTIAMIVMSCRTETARSSSGATCLLRSPTSGDWFDKELRVAIIGERGHKLSTRQLRFVSIHAQDEDGHALSTRNCIEPDSKFGPVAYVIISPAITSRNKIVISAEMIYGKQPVVLQANFMQQEGHTGWMATNVAVNNK